MALSLAIALGIWWNANTVAHYCIHRPPFRRRSANACVDAALSLLLGVPQSLWRTRHLAHHAGVAARLRPSAALVLQTLFLVTLWTSIIVWAPAFFVTTYVPGYLSGLLLCWLHGHYEHAAGTTSHYGKLYNLLLFNDGYHIEHHRHPTEHWARLPAWRERSARGSTWPAPLRWLDDISLEGLERIVLRSRLLQRMVLRSHARALRRLIAPLPTARSVAIVGGGLFPRTALIVRDLLPYARITIIDASQQNLERARAFLKNDQVTFVHQEYREPQSLNVRRSTAAYAPQWNLDVPFDLMVFPLSFDGDRRAIYDRPPAPFVLVHDWIWRRCGVSRVVSVALLKRVNLVRR
jgi:hypothetical protein